MVFVAVGSCLPILLFVLLLLLRLLPNLRLLLLLRSLPLRLLRHLFMFQIINSKTRNHLGEETTHGEAEEDKEKDASLGSLKISL